MSDEGLEMLAGRQLQGAAQHAGTAQNTAGVPNCKASSATAAKHLWRASARVFTF